MINCNIGTTFRTSFQLTDTKCICLWEECFQHHCGCLCMDTPVVTFDHLWMVLIVGPLEKNSLEMVELYSVLIEKLKFSLGTVII